MLWTASARRWSLVGTGCAAWDHSAVPPPVHFARSGDLNIAYQVVGSGPTDLLWCIGSYSHLDVLWENPGFARTFERLGESTRFVMFDKRGTGLSDRPDRIQTLEERIDDVRAVLDARRQRARVPHGVLGGRSDGDAVRGHPP
jgi:pimeloyl-ACP methyl ester carboxylesterase